MSFIDLNSADSLYSRRILLASGMLVIVMITSASLLSFPGYSSAPKISADKPKVGLVTGIVYSPPNSCAVVGGDMVHQGDSIYDIAVVAIQNDSVEFSKAGVTWRQQIHETPRRAWMSSAIVARCLGK